MADYFSRLADRALGAGPSVRPDVAPAQAFRFQAPEQVAAPAEERAEMAKSSGDEPRTLPQHSIGKESSGARAFDTRTPAPRASATEPSGITPPAGFIAREVVAAQPTPSADETGRQRIEPSRELERRASNDPRVQAAASIAPREIEEKPESRERPAVRITIGRIEVRAAAPPSPAPAATRAGESAGNRLRTLESYLAERNRGRE
jgi:hypothetical protein